jgi:hypothetical protein
MRPCMFADRQDFAIRLFLGESNVVVLVVRPKLGANATSWPVIVAQVTTVARTDSTSPTPGSWLMSVPSAIAGSGVETVIWRSHESLHRTR